ncbi:PAS domain-containing protein [Methanotrichaceae archaeon M04Ac]|jgi:PAS domain S-box-containing protein|uniref:histidine kinase n=1 Tax=Candidatus Methanocrinis alkalitolerans TaxID=3033395 RepID=A0ABT5XB96_9EURY|nr:PAS domain-containing protein [Candidatus Methanocrinis alkalitolerans]MCR3883845.1 PAS domain-containing protein [Methanothrix sp.]MDF0591999.1 PAS domain-containing protein [Candidatus Methanocrinis alkalitolerans]
MIRVLLVDDDPTLLELTRIFLERSGDIAVDAAGSALEALLRLEGVADPYDVVISDYAMPEMDGITFLKAVRGRKLDIPFILFTGKSREEVVIEALNSGVDYYIQKGGDPKVLFAELTHQIRQAADRERARREDQIERVLALELSGATSLSAALKLCVDAAMEVSEADCGTMYLLDRTSGSFVIRYSTGFSSEFVEEISKRRRSPGTSLIARAKRSIYIRYQDKDLPLQEAREREGLRAMAVVPVHHENEVVGYYSVGTHASDEIPHQRRSGLETIAAMTGNAIFRLQAEEDLRRSEEELRAIFKAAEVAFVITDATDPDPTVLEFSPGAEKIFGYSRQEMVGGAVSRLHLPEDVALFPEVHRQMREGGRGFSGLMTLVRKNGERFPALFSTHPLFDESGRMRAALGVSIDVTEQRLVEEALKESEERLKLAVEGGNLAVWDWNLATGEEAFSDKWCEILGYSVEELKASLGIWDRLVHPDDHARVKQALRNHLDGLTPYCETEQRMRSKDGRWVWIWGRGKVVSWDERGRPARMTGVIQEMRGGRGGSRDL